MATKKTVAKTSRPGGGKSAPAKKAVAPAKKAAASKKSAPVKKSAPAKKAPAKPAAKVPAKAAAKAAPKKAAPKKQEVKKAGKVAVKPAKKVATPVKAAPKKAVAKPAPAKKTATPAPAAAKKQATKSLKTETVAKKKEEAKKTSTASVPPKPAVKKAEPAKPAKPVVIPKTSTNVAVKYNPGFTKSILDEPVPESTGPTMRYSDNELTEFRDLINKKLDAARKELAYLQGLITRKDEMGGDNDDARYMTMEDGSMSMEREQLSQMASRQIQFIDHLEKALMRIENKTYGICRVTGKLIDKARLRAVPHATLSMEAKMGIVK